MIVKAVKLIKSIKSETSYETSKKVLGIRAG